MVCEVAVGVGGIQFQLVIAERIVEGRLSGESESHNNTAF